MKFRRNFSLFVIVFAFFAVSASAQDFYWNSASTRSMALGGVYVPSISDALGALTTNPAGLTYLSSPTLDLSMSAVFARGSFSNSVNNNVPDDHVAGRDSLRRVWHADRQVALQLRRRICPDLVSVSDWRYVDAPGICGVTYGMQEKNRRFWRAARWPA